MITPFLFRPALRGVCRRRAETGTFGRESNDHGTIRLIAAIVIYLLGMVYVGFYFSRKGGGSSSDEFYLGGRKLGPIVTAMSAEASDMSSWLLWGLPGRGLSHGSC